MNEYYQCRSCGVVQKIDGPCPSCDGELIESMSISDAELEDRYENFLDEAYDIVNVCGYEYLAGRLLRDIDPIAFRCGVNDWVDAEIKDGRLIEFDNKYFEVL